jgi:hypothetical protein
MHAIVLSPYGFKLLRRPNTFEPESRKQVRCNGREFEHFRKPLRHRPALNK